MIFRLAKRSVSIRDDDLHAYADGLLDGARLRRVEQHLAAHPEDAARVAAFRALNAGLADLGLATREEELSPALTALREDLSGALLRQRQVRRTIGGAMASVLMLGAASGTWMLSGWGPQEAGSTPQIATVETAPLTEVAEAPLEINSGTEAEIADWISRQVQVDRFSAPDLNSAGFKLSGARVISTPDGPLVQVHYRNSAEGQLTFTVSTAGIPEDGLRVDDLSERQLAIYWRRGSLTYSLVGPMRHADLAALADLVGGRSPEKQAIAADTGTASVQAASEKTPGVVLVDSNTDAAPASAPAARAAAEAPDESVKAPPATTIEKIEEPKPL